MIFLWKGGRGFIKRNTLIGNVEDGGIKIMANVKSMFKSLKIKWTQRYVDNNHAAWKKISMFLLSHMVVNRFYTVMLIQNK